jgi:hypothetical protein
MYFSIESLEILNSQIVNNQSVVNIFIEPVIIGKDYVTIEYMNLKLKHEIVILSPQRFIDQIHRIYIIIFQFINGIFMGILLDVPTLMKLFKMPIPVIVGFTTQYTLMPLVTN